jgi:hypothetical protein
MEQSEPGIPKCLDRLDVAFFLGPERPEPFDIEDFPLNPRVVEARKVEAAYVNLVAPLIDRARRYPFAGPVYLLEPVEMLAASLAAMLEILEANPFPR